MNRISLPSLGSFLYLVCFTALLGGCAGVSLDPVRFASQTADANRDETRLEKALHALCDRDQSEFCEKEARVLLENGKPGPAKIAAERGCRAGRHSACASEGDILLAEGNIPGAVKVLAEACESASTLDGVACPSAGQAAYLAGDAKRALQLWKRGCGLGNGVACYFEGRNARLTNKVTESLAPLKRACDGGVLGACSELAIGLSLEGNAASARENFARDCDRRSHRACRWLPLLEEKLKHPDLDKTLDRDCRKDNSREACYDSIVLQFLRKGGRTLALYRWKENCKAGHKMSCWENFVEETGMKPLTQMNSELESFCREGILVACYFRGLNLADEGHPERALTLWGEACTKGEAWSCFLTSESEALEESEKARYRQKACEFGLKSACAAADPALADMSVKSGRATSVDYSAACTDGDAEACTYAGLKKSETSRDGGRDGEAREYFRRACLASSTLGCEGLIEAIR